jgi:hypothetical protein
VGGCADRTAIAGGASRRLGIGAISPHFPHIFIIPSQICGILAQSDQLRQVCAQMHAWSKPRK